MNIFFYKFIFLMVRKNNNLDLNLYTPKCHYIFLVVWLLFIYCKQYNIVNMLVFMFIVLT